MDNIETFVLGLGIGLIVSIGSCGVGSSGGRAEAYNNVYNPARTSVENDKCSLQGGELLRGQQLEYVCVKPGSIKYKRKF